MLTLLPNENKSAIQMIFSDIFTEKVQFVTAFDLVEAREMAHDLLNMIDEIKGENHG